MLKQDYQDNGMKSLCIQVQIGRSGLNELSAQKERLNLNGMRFAMRVIDINKIGISSFLKVFRIIINS